LRQGRWDLLGRAKRQAPMPHASAEGAAGLTVQVRTERS